MDTLAVLTAASSLTAAVGTGLGWARTRTRLQIARDTVERLRHDAAEAAYAAHHDDLTGLPNRRWFTAAVSHHLLHPPGYSALVLLDLDGFKLVNDQLGHAAGDAVLVAVARRLSRFAASWPVARLGGDEFVLLAVGPYPGAVRPSTWPLPLAQNLRAALAEPIPVAGSALSVTCSVGVATLAEPCGLDELLSRADRALYRAKDTAEGVAVYSAEADAEGPGRSRPDRATRPGRTRLRTPCS
ncbi:GGDEF domain-containing protein [Longispora urticae]